MARGLRSALAIALCLCMLQLAGAATMSARALAVANWLTSQPVEQCFPGLIGEWVGVKHVQLAVRGSIDTRSEAIAEMQQFTADGYTSTEGLRVAFDATHGILAFRHQAEDELELALIGGAKAPPFPVANRDLSAAALGGIRIGSSRTDVERHYGVAKQSSRACGMTIVEYTTTSGTYLFDVVYAADNTVRTLVYGNVI